MAEGDARPAGRPVRRRHRHQPVLPERPGERRQSATRREKQGDVDYAGKADPAANTRVIASYPANDLRGGKASLSVDSTAGSFVRTQALDDSGAIVGLSNPVWLLRQTPPGGIPGPPAELSRGSVGGHEQPGYPGTP